MPSREKIGPGISDEMRYALDDIRNAWEQAWFGRDSGPSFALSTEMSEPDPPRDPMEPSVGWHNPDVPGALDGIGHAGGDDFNPDHTRDAVRSFYGLDRDDVKDIHGSTPDHEPLDDFLGPERPETIHGHEQDRSYDPDR